MKELYESDDELRLMIREEGMLSTSANFTERVMQVIGEEELKARPVYQPLLSRNAWLLIAISAVMLLAFCYLTLSGSAGNVRYFSEVMKPVADVLKQVDFSFHFSNRALLLAICIVSSVSVLLSIDIWITHKNPRLTA